MTRESDSGRVALVTGGSRGLGLETSRQLGELGFRVVLSARDERAARVADRLGAGFLRLDVADAESVASAASTLRERYGRLDVLVNNAGISMDGFDAEVARRTIEVNTLAPLAVTDAVRPLLAAHASVVMVSSGMGELSCLGPARREPFDDPDLSRERLVGLLHEFVRDVADGTYASRGWPRNAYRVSKVGLNALTRILAREWADAGIRVNAVCPGWVRTDMGGRGATRHVEEGARGIVWAATLPADGPSGGFFRDGQRIPW